MTKEEIKLWREIHKLNTQVGFLTGVLEAVTWWEIPEELKEKIKESLKTIRDEEDILWKH